MKQNCSGGASFITVVFPILCGGIPYFKIAWRVASCTALAREFTSSL